MPSTTPLIMQTETCKVLRLGLFILMFTGGLLLQAQENSLWTEKFQASTPEEVRKAAQPSDLHTGAQAAVLYRSGDYEYQADGSLKTVNRLVYLVQNPEGVKNWSSIQVGYSPWHEEKPVVTVRITHPDGTQNWVRTEDLLEVSGSADDSNIYSDSKLLKGPFPQIREGSVVEQEIRSHSRPLLDKAGVTRYWSFSPQVPESVNRLTVTVPAEQTLNYLTTLTGDLKPTITQSSGAKTYQFIMAPAKPYSLPAPGLPTDQLDWPSVTFSTAPDWKTLGELYGRTVTAALASAPFVAPQGIPSGNLSTRERVRRLLHWIDGKVRYTGLELGANSIIPVPPARVMERGFGDCKDKALLLITLLARSGVKARIALLKTGPGQDVEPGIPGMDHFNHAIVYVDEEGGFFVDPTVEYNREGKLPYWDQGRWALIAGSGTPGLIQTPLADSQENQVLISRTVTLSDDGPTALDETLFYTGDYEIFHRNRYAGEAPDSRKKRMESYGASVLLGRVKNFEVSSSEDLGAPFRSQITVQDSRLAFTENSSAWWEFNWNDLKSWLPDLLLENQESARKHPYQMNLASRVRWETLVIPPKGFVLRGMPAPVFRQWGPLTLSASAEPQGEGGLKVAVTLDTGKALYSGSEFTEVNQGLTDYLKAPPSWKTTFDHRAEQLFQGGNYREGFDSFRQLTLEEPKKAIHQIRLSSALLKMGLGDQAVLSAQTAVALEPQNPKAWANLGWTLEFNPLGRRFGRGWDREEAVAAFRKAVELESGAWYHRANLAILLEFDPTGFRHGRREDMEAARKEYELLGKDLDNGELRANYLTLLFLLGDYKALELQGSRAGKELKNLSAFLSAASLRGLEEGLKALEPQLEAAEKSRILASAGERLLQARMYSLAAQTFREAAKGSNDGVKLEYRADSLSGTVTREFSKGPAATPEEAVYQYLAGLAWGSGGDFSHLKDLTTPEFFSWGTNHSETPFYREWSTLARSALNQGISQATLTDLLLSRMELDVRGSEATGIHVGVRMEGSDSWDGYYLENLQGRWMISGTHRTMDLVAARILKFLEAGNITAAGLWLDWIYEDRIDSFQGTLLQNPLKAFWRAGEEPTREKITLAAQALKALHPQRQEDLEPVEVTLARVLSIGDDSGQDRITALRLILGEGWESLNDYTKALACVEPVYEKNQRDPGLLSTYFNLLRKAGQREKAEILIEDLMARYPRDAGVIRQGLYLYVTGIKHSALESILTRYNPRLDAADYNNLAWVSLFKPNGVTDQDLERGRRSVNMEPRNRAALHTLATLYAETGRYEDARKLLDQAMSLGYDMDPQSEDWYVLGRVAEGYGFREAALKAYDRVMPQDDLTDQADTYFLARKRSDILDPQMGK